MQSKSRVIRSLAVFTALVATGMSRQAAGAEMLSYTRNVSVADLDLASSQGEATLDRRIALAARAVCGAADPRDLAAAADLSDCRADAVRDARHSAARLVENAKQWARAANSTRVADARG